MAQVSPCLLVSLIVASHGQRRRGEDGGRRPPSPKSGGDVPFQKLWFLTKIFQKTDYFLFFF